MKRGGGGGKRWRVGNLLGLGNGRLVLRLLLQQFTLGSTGGGLSTLRTGLEVVVLALEELELLLVGRVLLLELVQLALQRGGTGLGEGELLASSVELRRK